MTKLCRNAPRAGYDLCEKCIKARTRAKDPVKTAYQNLRDSARKRGKEFTITLDYFRRFCKRTDYMVGKGRTKESYHVDRKDESKGYIPGNLQVLTNSENVKKFLNYSWETKQGYVTKKIPKKPDKDLPF